MENSTEAKLLRIFVGESDHVNHEPLYERIVYAAKKQGLAGATVLKGVMSFGANSRIHKSKMVALSEDLPIVVEIVDEAQNIDSFLDTVDELFHKSGSGGLVTIEKMDVIFYRPNNDK